MKYQTVSNQLPMKPASTRKRFNLVSLFLAAGLICFAASTSAQSGIFGHLNGGAVSQDAGAQLLWVNGSIFATNSGYSQAMPLSTAGTYNGYYNSGPTLTSLPTSSANNSGGPSPNAALQGSFLNVVLTLFSAPGGGVFGFWETGATTPTYNLNIGGSTPLIALSDASLGAGNPGADPYGHIHGRRFSGTVPGEYIVGLQLIDTSDLGPGATPLHTPSDVLTMSFTAVVPEPSAPALLMMSGLLFGAIRLRRNKSK